MAQHGGARPGGGKPKGSLAAHTMEAVELKKKLIAEYAANRAQIDKALIDKAKTGDVPAIKELYDRVWGKSSQPISGDTGNPLFPKPLLDALLNNNSN